MNFKIGDFAEARYKGGDEFFPGKVYDISSDNKTCTMIYGDGTLEENVPFDNMRPLSEESTSSEVIMHFINLLKAKEPDAMPVDLSLLTQTTKSPKEQGDDETMFEKVQKTTEFQYNYMKRFRSKEIKQDNPQLIDLTQDSESEIKQVSDVLQPTPQLIDLTQDSEDERLTQDSEDETSEESATEVPAEPRPPRESYRQVAWGRNYKSTRRL